MAIKKVLAENTENYIVKAEIEGFTYTMDFADRNENNEAIGTSPTGVLVTALAGCHLMTARSYLSRKDLSFNELAVEINGNFKNGSKAWTLDADVTLTTNVQLDETGVKALKRFIHRNCTVSSILSKDDNQIKLEIKIIK